MARTIDDCRDEMLRHLDTIHDDIDDIAGPKGRVTRLHRCVDGAKRNVSKILGGLGVVSLFVGLITTILFFTISGITTDVNAAQKDITELSKENIGLRADLSHTVSTMEELKVSMNGLKSSLDELNKTYLALLYTKSFPPYHSEVPR